jgi:hypothetical protein
MQKRANVSFWCFISFKIKIFNLFLMKKKGSSATRSESSVIYTKFTL